MNKIFMLILFLIVGCATGEKARDIVPGMSQDQVVSSLGNPDEIVEQEDSVVFIYKDRLESGWGWDRSNYSVVFRDGVVVSKKSKQTYKHEISDEDMERLRDNREKILGAGKYSKPITNPDKLKQIDYSCQSDCLQLNYSYGYCSKKCEY